MKAAFMLAIHRNARPHYFAQPVYVVSGYTQSFFNFAPHVFRPRLRTEDSRFKLEFINAKPHLFNCFG